MSHTLESTCQELRLSRIPYLIDSVEGATKEEWLKMLDNEFVCHKEGNVTYF